MAVNPSSSSGSSSGPSPSIRLSINLWLSLLVMSFAGFVFSSQTGLIYTPVAIILVMIFVTALAAWRKVELETRIAGSLNMAGCVIFLLMTIISR